MSTNITVTSAPQPGHTAERGVVITIMLASMLVPLNSTMIAVALPGIIADLHVDASSAGWLVTTYLIVMATLQPVAGKSGDHLGRRRLMLAGLAGFGVATVGAACAPNLAVLIACRTLQGIAGALTVPNGTALLREAIPEARRAQSAGLVGAGISLAAAIGPPVGGLIAALAGWRAIFMVNVVLIVPALVLGRGTLPTRASAQQRHPFDVAGAALLSALLVGTSALLMAGGHGFGGSALPGGAALMSALGWLLHHEARHADPVLQLRLFRNRAFAAATGAIALSNFAMYVTLLALPVWLAQQAHWGSARIGVLLTALSAMSVLTAPAGGRLAQRYGRRWPTVAGLAVFALGLALLTPFLRYVGTGSLTTAIVAGGLTLAGAGLGLSSAGLQVSAIEAVAGHAAGVAAGLFSTGRYFGSIVGASILAGALEARAHGRNLGVMLLMSIGAALAAALISMWLRDRPEEAGPVPHAAWTTERA
jgi:EmrB/QacA subfamily drug resistance transporter